MTSTTSRFSTPAPVPGPGEGLGAQSGVTTRVAHRGGPRHGTVAEVAAAALSTYLVYDGPRWFGVYEPADPPRLVPTPRGPAQLWVAVDR